MFNSIYSNFSVLGTHSNVCALLDKRKKVPFASYLVKINKRVTLASRLLADTKYFHIHATKPKTIGKRHKKFIIRYKIGRLEHICVMIKNLAFSKYHVYFRDRFK